MSVEVINENEFNEKVKGSNKVLIDCYADWCGPCKMLAPVIDEVAKETDICEFYKINVDDASQIVEKFEIMSIPTILFFENGELKQKLVGFQSKDVIENLING